MVGTGEHIGEPISNFDRLRNLLNYSRESEIEIPLNESERIVIRRYWEERQEGVMCQLISDYDKEVTFWLMEDDRISAIGFRGLAVKLGDSWLSVTKFLEINGSYLGDMGETENVAAYVVDFVSKAISEKRIPGVEIPLNLPQR